MDCEFLINEEPCSLTLKINDGYYLVKDRDGEVEAEVYRISPNELSVKINNHSYKVYMARRGKLTFFFCDGETFTVREPVEEEENLPGEDSSGRQDQTKVKAPMPGKVIKVCVSAGSEVRKNQTLVIVEAMKMENEIKAGMQAVVKNVFTTEGELVDPEKTLVELEKQE